MSILVNVYSTLNNPPAIYFPCDRLYQSGLDNPEFMDHLNNFIDLTMKSGDGQMNAHRYALYRHIQRIKHQFSFVIEEDKLNELAAWGWQANVIIYMPDRTICNPDMDVLLEPDDNYDVNAIVPYRSDALHRKAKTEHYLETLGLYSFPSLLPVVAESELILRTPSEVTKRALTLIITAMQAENFRVNNAINPT